MQVSSIGSAAYRLSQPVTFAVAAKVRAESPTETTPAISPVARPFLKWVGGKGKLVDQIVPLLPIGPLHYGEAFLGGGALFFALHNQKRLRSATLTDLSTDVVNAHTCVRDRPRELHAALQAHEKAYTTGDEAARADYFYRVRAMHPDFVALDPVERAARMMFLNRTCFNGLWRENAGGKFNSPHGRYANPAIANEDRIWGANRALQDATLVRADFRQWPELVRTYDIDFVYLDPPYQPVTATSAFNAYSGGAFSANAQRELAQVCGELDKLNVRWALSNSDCPMIRTLYKSWTIHTVRAPRSVNSKADGRGDVNEVVVTNRRAGLSW